MTPIPFKNQRPFSAFTAGPYEGVTESGLDLLDHLLS